jgi:hypothetical protein
MAHRDPEQYERAKRAIAAYLQDGGWHASRELHERLADQVPKDWLFGAVKKDLCIQHHRMKGRYYWRLSLDRDAADFPAP